MGYRQAEPAAELAGLAFVDPAARAYKEELLAKAAAAAARDGARVPAIELGEPTESPAESSDETQNVADVIAALKAEVHGGIDVPEPDGSDSGELEEMQKIRRILDDLE